LQRSATQRSARSCSPKKSIYRSNTPRRVKPRARSARKEAPKQPLVPLNAEKRETLLVKHRLFESAESATCAICQKTLAADEECVVRLPCGEGHEFHFECLEAWFDMASQCPTCRQELSLEGHSTSTSSTGRNTHGKLRGAAARRRSLEGQRRVVTITDIEAKYKVARGEMRSLGDRGDVVDRVFFIRRMHMRDKVAYDDLKVGDRAEMTLSYRDGIEITDRAIISDVIPL
jgi:hypothetical protein